jgi:uncharacterized protein (TIGR02391 family)
MISLTPDEASELPIDELGLLILQDMVDVRERNDYNYVLRYKQDRACGFGTNPQAVNAVAEACGWLRNHGMIAREAGNTSPDAIFVTRRGHEALAKGLSEVRASSRIEGGLHPLLERKVRRQFLLGEYESAILTAMKLVEIRVRKLGGFADDKVGVPLMTQAFKEGGPLADPTAPNGEVVGTMSLFNGAYAVLRNPSAHREVSFDDAAEASEAVMTASLLMRILDRIERRITI